MNSFFQNFEKSTIVSIPYKHDPIIFFIDSVKRLQAMSSGEEQISFVLNQCFQLLNKFISARKIIEDDITKTRKACETLKYYRSEIRNAAKDIFGSIRFIDINNIIIETLENIIINNNNEMYGLLVESNDQWEFMFEMIRKNGLHEFLKPVFTKTAREQYFDIPIITFLPANWISGLVTLPPSEKFILIHPENIFINGFNTFIFKAPNDQSLEITTDNLNLKRSEVISVKPSQEFYLKFSASFCDEMIIDSATSSLISCEQPLSMIEVVDSKREFKFIECNKEYLVIDKDGKIKYSSFENSDQIQTIKYIVDRIDTSCLTSEDLKRKQNIIMEKWKKPLRDYPHIDGLIKELEMLGAKRASIVNIKNWYNPNNIAPGNFEDYKSVLSFAGVRDKQEVDKFFELARKRRGDSISEGHDKKIIGQEIVRDFLESFKSDVVLKSEYQIQGIKFSLIALG
jgi:hypothetical protein